MLAGVLRSCTVNVESRQGGGGGVPIDDFLGVSIKVRPTNEEAALLGAAIESESRALQGAARPGPRTIKSTITT